MKVDNRHVFEPLIVNSQIDLARGSIFDTPPPPLPDLDFDRIEGMLLGIAIGDGLGNTSEGILPGRRRERYGEIRDYLPDRRTNEARGFPSDDTQLSFWALEQILSDGRFDPEHVAARFCRDRIFGLGATVRQFIGNYKAGVPWYECGPRSMGNGSLMRIAPILIPHLKSQTSELWSDTALCAMITHNDSGAIASCLAFVSILWQLLSMKTPPQPEWWLSAFVETARQCERGLYRPRGGAFTDYHGPVWKFVNEKLPDAFERDLSVVDACRQWYSGAYLLETVPSVLYILMKHGHDPEEAIVRAVNDTKDNDTIAAIVGAVVGALYGKKRLPERWISNLSGRTTDRDNGRIFDLIRQVERWVKKDHEQV
jgi:ADP-ribosylglycohydrolase